MAELVPDINTSIKNYNIIFDLIKNHEWEKLITKISSSDTDFDVNIKDQTNNYIIIYAVIYNQISLVKKLYEHNARIDILDADEKSILYYPIKFSYDSMLEFLLQLNKDTIGINILEIKDKTYKTALHYAIIKNFKSTIIELIHYKADINIPDYYANTSLHYAVSEKNNEIIKIIIKYAPNYDFQNIDGDTALHMYLDNNNMDIEILENLILKTNLNIQNNKGVTCLKKLLYLDLFMDYIEILENKELNFFITDKENENMDEYLENQSILRIAINSYYNTILIKKENLIEVWEKKCADLKLTDKDCKETIKKIILKEKINWKKKSRRWDGRERGEIKRVNEIH